MRSLMLLSDTYICRAVRVMANASNGCRLALGSASRVNRSMHSEAINSSILAGSPLVAALNSSK